MLFCNDLKQCKKNMFKNINTFSIIIMSDPCKINHSRYTCYIYALYYTRCNMHITHIEKLQIYELKCIKYNIYIIV